jgi:hypothetical protein
MRQRFHVAHLKFLRRKRRILFRNFRWKGGMGAIGALVRSTFRSS